MGIQGDTDRCVGEGTRSYYGDIWCMHQLGHCLPTEVTIHLPWPFSEVQLSYAPKTIVLHSVQIFSVSQRTSNLSILEIDPRMCDMLEAECYVWPLVIRH